MEHELKTLTRKRRISVSFFSNNQNTTPMFPNIITLEIHHALTDLFYRSPGSVQVNCNYT